jgi:hypothetical protein
VGCSWRLSAWSSHWSPPAPPAQHVFHLTIGRTRPAKESGEFAAVRKRLEPDDNLFVAPNTIAL